MRMRKKKNLGLRLARCTALLAHDPAARRGRWREGLPQEGPLYLELGCGKGRFTCETAQAHPRALIVGVERIPDVMVIAAERAMEAGCANVLFVRGDAAFLEDYFAPGEVDRIYINFCDPWPGNRHAKRRLTHGGFLARYRALLRGGGEIHFKTDNRDLFEFSLSEFERAGYRLTQVTRDLHADGVKPPMTDYEEKFHAQGLPICRCVAVAGEEP